MGACMKRAWPPRPSFPLDQAAIPLHRRRVSIKTLAPKRRGASGFTTWSPGDAAAAVVYFNIGAALRGAALPNQ
jgi:hypothetical protein